MNLPFKKIMLVTNEPSDARGAEETALTLAKANNAEVLIVDSIRTPFHASRFPSLTTELMYEAALKSKQRYLDELKTRFESEGITTTTDVLFSPRTSAELVEKAVAAEVDLVIRYMKGQSSRAVGRFGQTAENLMRACPMPVLLTNKLISNPGVVACVNLEHGPEENQAILDSARQVVSSSSDLNVLSCWEYSDHDFMQGAIDQSSQDAESSSEGLHEQTRNEMGKIYRRLFEEFQSNFSVEDLDDRVHLINGNPVVEIPKFCRENKMDLAVMCSATLHHPIGRTLGGTIEKTIDRLPCALLTVKPIGFVRPHVYASHRKAEVSH